MFSTFTTANNTVNDSSRSGVLQRAFMVLLCTFALLFGAVAVNAVQHEEAEAATLQTLGTSGNGVIPDTTNANGSYPTPQYDYSHGMINLGVGAGKTTLGTGWIDTYNAPDGSETFRVFNNQYKQSNCYALYSGGAKMGTEIYDVKVYFWNSSGQQYRVSTRQFSIWTYPKDYGLQGIMRSGSMYAELHFYKQNTSTEVSFAGILEFNDINDLYQASVTSENLYKYYVYPDTYIGLNSFGYLTNTASVTDLTTAGDTRFWALAAIHSTPSSPVTFGINYYIASGQEAGTAIYAHPITVNYKVSPKSPLFANQSCGSSYVSNYGEYTVKKATKDVVLDGMKDGTTYTIKGWYDNEYCTGTPVTHYDYYKFSNLINGSPNHPTTLYAWIEAKYPLRYDLNGGSSSQIYTDPKSVYSTNDYAGYFDEGTLSYNCVTTYTPTRAGYKFLGWSTVKQSDVSSSGTDSSVKTALTAANNKILNRSTSKLGNGSSWSKGAFDETLYATWAEIPAITVTVVGAIGGNAQLAYSSGSNIGSAVTSSATYTYTQGSSVKSTFTPSSGYEVKYAKYDGSNVTSSLTSGSNNTSIYSLGTIYADHTVQVAYTPIVCKVTVTKQVKKSDLYSGHGDGVFTFKLQGTSSPFDYANKAAYFGTITFSGSETANSSGYVTKSYTFEVPIGKYTLSEMDATGYTCSLSSTSGTNNGNNTATLNFTSVTSSSDSNAKATTTFTNTKTDWEDLRHTTSVTNHFSN